MSITRNLTCLLAMLLVSCSSPLEAPSSIAAVRSEGSPAPLAFEELSARSLTTQALVSAAHGGQVGPRGHARLAAIASSRADAQVVAHLAELGAPLRARQLPVAAAPDRLEIAQGLPEAVVLWVDSQAAELTVLRQSDGTVLSRVLPPETFVQTPYVAALAANELLRLLRETPAEAPRSDRSRANQGSRGEGHRARSGVGLPSCAAQRGRPSRRGV